jgi:hypothetical protein
MNQLSKNCPQFNSASGLSFAPRSKVMMSIRSTLKECARDPDACHHIAKPKDPKVLFGMPILEIEKALEKLIKRCKDPLGRKIRADAIVLTGGVVSINLPPTLENINSKSFKKWLKKVHKFLLKKFGEQYVNLTLHTDEKFLHCHYFILPSITKDGLLDTSNMHPGIAAQAELRGTKAGKQQKDIVYKEAMRKYQDEFYEEVSAECGHTRYGPRRRRLTRKEWHKEQNQANLLARIIEAKNEQLERMKSKLMSISKVFNIFKSNKNNNKGTNHEYI